MSISAELNILVRLPTEQEWQRAALGNTNWNYPWGNELDETRGNFAKRVGKVSVYLRAIDRGEGHSPRGRLNDYGFRIALQPQ